MHKIWDVKGAALTGMKGIQDGKLPEGSMEGGSNAELSVHERNNSDRLEYPSSMSAHYLKVRVNY